MLWFLIVLAVAIILGVVAGATDGVDGGVGAALAIVLIGGVMALMVNVILGVACKPHYSDTQIPLAQINGQYVQLGQNGDGITATYYTLENGVLVTHTLDSYDTLRVDTRADHDYVSIAHPHPIHTWLNLWSSAGTRYVVHVKPGDIKLTLK